MSNVTTVRHLDRDHIVITPAPGSHVTVFNFADVEALIVDKHGAETIRVKLADPDEGQNVMVQTRPDGVVHVIYTRPNSGS
jgi:hypothetical protein